jgi:THO complex subunit 2
MDPPASTEPLNRVSNAAPQAETPSVAEVPTPSAQPILRPFYTYDYITDKRVQAWRTTGQRDVVNDARALRQNEDDIGLGVLFNELVVAALTERLSGEAAGLAVKEILGALSDFDFTDLPSFFLDNFSIVAEAEQQILPKIPPHPSLKTLLRSSGISPSLIREVLDVEFLMGLGMVRNTFKQMGIRHSTSALYRMSAFNLLREETEGYSKLITEYFTVTGSLSPSYKVVEETWEKIQALIGAFDLDVGRVLDVTLDAFANALIKHNRFFIKFLRISCWWPAEKFVDGFEPDSQGFDSLPPWADPGFAGWETTPEDRLRLTELKEARDIKFWDRVREAGMDAFFELGGRRALPSSEKTDMVNTEKIGDALDAGQDWTRRTGTYPPRGNQTAAQLLGFKLRFYASESRDATDTLPENLVRVAALLIKIGFISFRDLYPHLYPLDEDMVALKDKLTKEKQQRKRKEGRGGGGNALTMAGALSEEDPRSMGRNRDQESKSTPLQLGNSNNTTPAPVKTEEITAKLPEPEDQKIHLLRDLLLIGAIPEALYMLGRFPWLLDLYPDLPPYLFRILHHSLDKVYAEAQPRVSQTTVSTKKKLVYAGPDAKGQLTSIDRPTRRTLKWAHMDTPEFVPGEADYGIDYKYYWDDWADNVPVCQNVDDVFTLCDSLLNLVGIKIGQDAELLIKLTRIGKKSLVEDKSENNFNRWFDLLKRVLVPALSLTECNSGVVNELWEVMKLFPTRKRFEVYSDWFTGPTSRKDDLKEAFEKTRAETRDVLKRISRTNTKAMARALAKVALASPGVVFMVTLNQIESYNNLIEVVVECGRYFTFLGYEVLTWALLNALGGAGRNRMQGDGMLTSPWLKALSTFAGRVYRRYSTMDAAPILQYVAYELGKGRSEDLEVLSEMVDAMAGIRPDTTWSEEQCLAMAGKSLLRSQTLKQLGDRRTESKLQARRLAKSLKENNLTGPLLICIALERQNYAFRDSTDGAPIKVLSSNISKLHDDLIQYLDMLRTNLTVEEFDAAVPAIEALVGEHEIDANVAWTISRPSIQSRIDVADKADAAAKLAAEEKAQLAGTDQAVNGDVNMTDAAANTTKVLANGTDDVVMKEGSDSATPASTDSPKPDGALHPVLQDLIYRLTPILGDDFGKTISLSFYVRFWHLTLSDLVVPPYDKEIKRLQASCEQIKADRSDMSPAGQKKRDAQVQAMITLGEKIAVEFREHVNHAKALKKKITESGEKDVWLIDFPGKKCEGLADAMLQELFLPRLVLSPLDALYAAKFIFWIHKLGTPCYKTVAIFEHIFRHNQLAALISQFTEKEAKNFGVFLNEILMELSRWHKDAAIYEKEAYGPKKDHPFPGFSMASTPDGMGMKGKLISYEQFRTLLYSWHTKLFGALKSLLVEKEGGTGTEYMDIRNSFQILKGVHNWFPQVNFMGDMLEKEVTKLSTSDPRDDIRLSAISLLGDLKKHRKEWVIPQAFKKVRRFHPNRMGHVISNNLCFQGPGFAQGESPAAPKSVQPASGPSSLDPKAPEFKSTATTA